jgi:hypothetical protein
VLNQWWRSCVSGPDGTSIKDEPCWIVLVVDAGPGRGD